MANDNPKKKSNITQFLLVFLIVYLGSQFVITTFFPKAPQGGGGIVLSGPASFRLGVTPILTLTNGTSSGFTLPARCPSPPLEAFVVGADGKASTQELTVSAASGSKLAIACDPSVTVAAGKSAKITLAPWKFMLFGKAQMYEVDIPAKLLPPLTGSGADAPKHVATFRFSITEAGVFTQLFRTFITKPFLNFLIFVASLTPGHNLGIAIIVLTLVVKLLLFWPTQRAMESQKKMQMLQPKLDELKKRYPDDAKKQQEETMKLWKEHGINPFGACLPTLIQLPILIGLLNVIRDGSTLGVAQHLIYGFYAHLDWSFGTQFLWFNLLKPDFYVFPVLLVAMQFIQMKMAFAIQKRKAAKAGKEQVAGSSQDTQQKVMLYVFPLMIGVFAFQFPAAVSLYWAVSTLFGIGQQAVVNREHLKV